MGILRNWELRSAPGLGSSAREAATAKCRHKMMEAQRDNLDMAGQFKKDTFVKKAVCVPAPDGWFIILPCT
ncbi:MAG TPA: hypothetical protein DIT97_10505 [Gimesia maris]|uniref:Uncharacterized protein n=1 Tax=Gimesia maris TaxID=122 RepID=A0A3D3R619_9PLAN|nr:hypothetical protein [Gimesia maris]